MINSTQTGEPWTDDMVAGMPGYGINIADAHNAALATERETKEKAIKAWSNRNLKLKEYIDELEQQLTLEQVRHMRDARAKMRDK